ncbi:hypothetical protein [Deinococcus rubellus]|uniref:hypothetical protein n=1 Tax=Deinococcus rubellus TaxID=1889240 RepID=UPI0031EC4716
MPAPLEVTFHTEHLRPPGLLFHALERLAPELSASIHAAQLKPFHISQSDWQDDDDMDRVVFQVGVLNDALLEALALETDLGQSVNSLCDVISDVQISAQESYVAMYSRHAESVSGRHFTTQFLTPTTFRVTEPDMLFPVPKTVFFGLQQRWETMCDLNLGGSLNDWVGWAVHMQDFRLRSQSGHFKCMCGAAMTAFMGEVDDLLNHLGSAELTFVLLQPGICRS